MAVHELFDLLFVQTIEFPDLPMHFSSAVRRKFSLDRYSIFVYFRDIAILFCSLQCNWSTCLQSGGGDSCDPFSD